MTAKIQTKTKVLRQKQKQKPKVSLRQKQKQSVIVNITTNQVRSRARAQPSIKPSYLQTITTYPIFREAPYEPLYRNTEPIKEVTAPFIDKTTPVMVNTPPIPQRVNEVPLVATQEFGTPSSKILQKIREESAARQKIFADKYEKKNRDSFEDRMTFADSFRRQNLDRAFDTQPTTSIAAQEFETPPVKTKLRSSAKRVLSIDREVVAQPPALLAVRKSLLTTPKKVAIPRRMGIPPRVLGTPDQEAKRAKKNERERTRYAINKAEKALMKVDESEKSAK